MDASSCALMQFFTTVYAPLFLSDASPRTIAEYLYSLGWWTRLTSDPAIAAIDVMSLAAFKAALAKKLAAPTVNKHLRHLCAILTKAGPPGPRNRDAIGVIPVAPWVKPLQVQFKFPRYLDHDELNRLYDATSSATRPKLDDVKPRHWWRLLIVLAYNLALRKTPLLGITWDDVDLKTRQLRVTPVLDKRNRERVKPLNETVTRHLMRLRRPSGRILEWPHGSDTFYTVWRAINRIAFGKNFQPYTPHDLKRTSATAWSKHASPWAVRYILDHAPGDVTGLYVDPREEVWAAAQTLPQPSSFNPLTLHKDNAQ